MKVVKNLLKLLVITLLLEESFAQGKCLIYVKDSRSGVVGSVVWASVRIYDEHDRSYVCFRGYMVMVAQLSSPNYGISELVISV